MRRKGWTIDSFRFPFNGVNYIVLVILYLPGEEKGYALVKLDFLHPEDFKYHLLVPANSNGLICGAMDLRIFFRIPPDYEHLGDALRTLTRELGYCTPIIAMFTGMRQGELLGLPWECVDFATGIITVKQQLQCIDGNYFMETPKNGKKRTILPAPIVMDTLRNEMKKQQTEKARAGDLWDNHFNLVFTDALGKNLVRRTVVKHFKKIIQLAEISDDARFHDLRHSFAVTSLYAGDDIKTVQTNLGHATAQFTLDTYGHVTQKMRQDSANRMQQFYEQLSK